MLQPPFEKLPLSDLTDCSSLARVIKAEHLANDIVASTRLTKNLEDAKALGLISHGLQIL